jgi:putative endonuclease
VAHTIKQGPSEGWFRRLLRRLGWIEAGPAHLRTGEWGEAQAEAHLRAVGLTVLGRRVRVGRHDEIDLMAREGDTLVFVEVKTRASEAHGRPGQAVDRSKRHILRRAALRYLQALSRPPRHYRFDLVEVVGDPEGGVRAVRHYPNALPITHPDRRPR